MPRGPARTLKRPQEGIDPDSSSVVLRADSPTDILDNPSSVSHFFLDLAPCGFLPFDSAFSKCISLYGQDYTPSWTLLMFPFLSFPYLADALLCPPPIALTLDSVPFTPDHLRSWFRSALTA